MFFNIYFDSFGGFFYASAEKLYICSLEKTL